MSAQVSKGELALYNTEDGSAKFFLRAEDGTVWLSQLELADLFQATKQNISLHIKNILAEGELSPAATVKEYLTGGQGAFGIEFARHAPAPPQVQQKLAASFRPKE
jgi:hypothetical protein